MKQVITYTLKLKTNNLLKKELNKRLKIGEDIYKYTLRSLLKKEIERNKDPLYKKAYKLEKGKDRNNILKELDKKYKISSFSTINIANNYRKKRHYDGYIPSTVSARLGARAFNSFKKKFYTNRANRVNFQNDNNSLTGIIGAGMHIKDGKLHYGVNTYKNKILVIPIKYQKDQYEEDILRGKIVECRILRRRENNKDNFYIQLILEHKIAPRKYDTTSISGNVGIDIGTSTVAISSYYETKLEELSPNIKNYDKEINRLNRKLERQRRLNNIENYNENGTIKKGKKKWFNSKRYYKTLNKIRNLKAKQSSNRNISHKKLANELLTLGDRFVVEQMSFAGLQKKAIKTKVSEKTGKIVSKKRFGKIIGNKAPAMFISILKQKVEAQGKIFIEANTREIKASQLNHITGGYTKVSLGIRVKTIGEEKVQRDLYSAFLLSNVNDDAKTVDLLKCEKEFNNFLKNQDVTMLNLKTKLKSTGIDMF